MTEDQNSKWPNPLTAGGGPFRDNEGLREAAMPHGELWLARPELRAIYENSRRLMVAPWAMLGLAITRSLISIPYWVQYQSFMGPAPLNIGCVFIGDSGGGKSRLNKALDQALPFVGTFVPNFKLTEVGSGEAMADVYAHPAEKDDPDGEYRRGDLLWHNLSHSRLFSFDEVGRMFKVGNRDQGSTIFEYVKQGLSGGPLGRHLAKGAGTLLDGDQYRFGFLTNAQPGRAGLLLSPDEIEGGFPGRLLWFETRDPRAVSEEDKTPIEPYAIKDIDWRGQMVVNRLPQMDDFHRADAARYHLDQRAPIDAHLGLLRAKVAVALMRLNGRIFLNDEDWDLSGIVIAETVRVRTWVQQLLAARAKDADKARGESIARQQVAAENAKEMMNMKRIVDLLRTYQRDGFQQKDWRGKLPSRDREFYPEALRLMGL